MAFSELFSISFLFSISIIIVLFGALYSYFNYKIGEQDHKLNSMIGLVSTMAEESQFFRNKLQLIQQQLSVTSKETENENIQYSSQMMGAGDLIPVSDDSSSDEDSDVEVSDDDNDSNTSEDDDTVSDDESGNESDEESDEEDVHQINLLDETNNDEIEDLNHTEIKTIHLEQPIDINVEQIEIKEEPTEINIVDDNILFLKNISMNDLGEIEDVHKPEYKKMSLNKLRDLVVSKGLIEDASKLKKNEILKMLGDE